MHGVIFTENLFSKASCIFGLGRKNLDRGFTPSLRKEISVNLSKKTDLQVEKRTF